jgi:hypothetical protein
MKKIVYSLVFLLPLFGFAQTKAEDKIIISKTLTAMPGEFYVDSVKVDINKTFLDADNIKMVNVFKSEAGKKDKKIKGATLITRKSKPHLIFLNELMQGAVANSEKLQKAEKIKVMLNGNEITHTDGYLFERSAIENFDIITDDKEGKALKVPVVAITTKQAKARK